MILVRFPRFGSREHLRETGFYLRVKRSFHPIYLPVPQHLAEDDGVGEVAVLKVYIGQELVADGGADF